MGLFDSLKRGLERSREALNEVFYFGGDVDEDFWEDLEDTLVMGDMGADIACSVTDDLRDEAARKNRRPPRSSAVRSRPDWHRSSSSPAQTSSATPPAACCSSASTAPERPPRSASWRATWRTDGRPHGFARQRRHLPRRRHRAARRVGLAAPVCEIARASAERPRERLLRHATSAPESGSDLVLIDTAGGCIRPPI